MAAAAHGFPIITHGIYIYRDKLQSTAEVKAMKLSNLLKHIV